MNEPTTETTKETKDRRVTVVAAPEQIVDEFERAVDGMVAEVRQQIADAPEDAGPVIIVAVLKWRVVVKPVEGIAVNPL